MTPSPRIADFIKSFEACRLVAYKPTPSDVATLGWGSTGPDIHLGMSWTQADADERFAADLAKFGAGVEAKITSPTNQNQYDACVSFSYNVGLGAFEASTLLRKHNAGDYEGAAAEFPKWVKQGSETLNGLVKRRAAEQAIYEEAV